MKIFQKPNNSQWGRCLENKVFSICRCPAFMLMYGLPAVGPGCTPSVCISAEKPVPWNVFWPGLFWLEKVFQFDRKWLWPLLLITPRFQSRSGRCKDDLTVTRRGEFSVSTFTFSLMWCGLQKNEHLSSVSCSIFSQDLNRRELVNIPICLVIIL